MIRVVPAGVLHARETAALLNETFKLDLTADDVKARMSMDRANWSVAETALGSILGVQWIEPAQNKVPDEAEIATVVRDGQGLDVGSALFEHTRAQAKRLGYLWINAEVRPNNERSLSYYQSKGFDVFRRGETIRMRFEL